MKKYKIYIRKSLKKDIVHSVLLVLFIFLFLVGSSFHNYIVNIFLFLLYFAELTYIITHMNSN
ncbi:hypothetical protein B6U56_04390 [Ligilactobacillus salivarius]|uniref:Uncharacterized protein n=1 Tax=Ligilactobacillus salivarius TaxID=1624 RepID=A0A1V9RBK8_9LACO|nr:hypothetical protein B6U56_04390 [Ligilactobacillus salivarius]